MPILAALLSLAILYLCFKEQAEALTLEHFEDLPDADLPGLSVVVAARDEETVVGPALESLLSLDYPDLEVVFVNDRSRDRTLEIAERLRREHPGGERLNVLDCQALPAGWLGKLHAQHLGAKASTRPLILLTDADVHYRPGSLRRAISAQRVLACDHLVVAPRLETRGFWEPALVGFFLLLFAARFRPARVHLKKKRFVGVGAFNLLTREALERCRYLEPLRLQVVDDVHLGRLIKSRGMTQYCLLAMDRISVRWIQGLRGCVVGLEKNAYAGLHYNLGFALAVIPMVAQPFWVPLLLVWLGLSGWALAYLLFLALLGLTIPGPCRLPRWVGLTIPLSSLVLAYTFARSVWLTEARGGVEWRGTRYSLDTLRTAHRDFVENVAPL